MRESNVLIALGLENRSIALCEKPPARCQLGIVGGSIWSKIASVHTCIE